jgi:hypothetical protein
LGALFAMTCESYRRLGSSEVVTQPLAWDLLRNFN